MFSAIAWFTAVQITLALVVFLLVLHLLRDLTRPLVTRMIPIQRRMQNGFFRLQSRLTIGTNLLLASLIAVASYVGLARVKSFFLPELDTQTKSANFSVMDYTNVMGMDRPKAAQLPVDDSLLPIETSPEILEEDKHEYVLQIGAFTAVHRAKRMQKRWQNQTPHRVYVVEMPQEVVQYKVLIGNFEQSSVALTYAKQINASYFMRKYEPKTMTEVP